ncbi:MAG: transglutaminase family protein [Clostridiales bacterium]|nr:transglutaminase family protein [Clostridiales bacterium]
MKWLFFHYDTFLEFERPVNEHQFMLRCMPDSNGRQRVVRAEVSIKPMVPISHLEDGFGNKVQSGCIPFDHTSFHYSSDGEAFVFENNKDQSPLNPVFRYPSGLARPSQKIKSLLESMALAGKDDTEKAMVIMETVSRTLEYVSGSTDTETTAAQAYEKGTGVCQDFTHLFISLARLAGLPARYANGLVVGEGASHAWAEIYSDGCWTGYDPTRNTLVTDDYLRLSVGRDFYDCSIERGVFLGESGQRQTVQIKVHEASNVQRSDAPQQQQQQRQG